MSGDQSTEGKARIGRGARKDKIALLRRMEEAGHLRFESTDPPAPDAPSRKRSSVYTVLVGSTQRQVPSDQVEVYVRGLLDGLASKGVEVDPELLELVG